MRRIIIFILLVFILQSILFAGSNPFAPKKQGSRMKKSIQYPVFMQKIFNKINPLQHRLNNKLAKLIHEIKEKKSNEALFLILLISFLYGIIHGIEPGHGKTITFSYFLSKKGNIKKGITMSSLIAFMHAGSALIIVFILYIIIKKSFLASFDEISSKIKLIKIPSFCPTAGL